MGGSRYDVKVRVGGSGASVWRVGLGGAPIGGLFSQVTGEEAAATVKAALRLGLRHLDTAPYYGMGLSEERIGEAIRGRRRGEYTVSTKVGRVLVPVSPDKPPGAEWSDTHGMTAVFDFSEDGIRKSVEGSRARLGVEDFDILFLHDCDGREEEAVRHAYPALKKMKEAGEVRAIGAGLNRHETALKLAKAAEFDCFLLAGRYTLLEQGAMDEFFPYCADRTIGVIAGGVFNSGILASGVGPGATYDYARAPREVLEKARKIGEACEQAGVSLKAAALQFVLASPVVTSVVIGCRSPAEVEQNFRALGERVPRGLWDGLKSRGLLREDAPTP
ncbi:MAG: aldo/keto reductase [Nitrososphaerota archaeon]|jgi:D-threo-aldose 1-dehydrogenase|nr:aldo/keto reductase [Nitrososphaerota archaeon]MDG6981339.1 aldo/keto reductase [Nitrososphaerota archaeon]